MKALNNSPDRVKLLPVRGSFSPGDTTPLAKRDNLTDLAALGSSSAPIGISIGTILGVTAHNKCNIDFSVFFERGSSSLYTIAPSLVSPPRPNNAFGAISDTASNAMEGSAKG